MQGTKTDADASEWALADDVVRLRQWGTDVIHPLPVADHGEWSIGSAESSWIRLQDDKGRVSRRHAALTRDHGRWTVRDLASKNGIKIDRLRRDSALLEPGLELWIGGVTLLAESTRSIALRGFLARLLGWSSARTKVVDEALRTIRLSASHGPLVLCGDDDLVFLARALHRRVLGPGPDRPFVLCDPRRQRSGESVRVSANVQSGMAALQAATRGTLCVWSHRLPRDFAAVTAALQDPDSHVHLVVCSTEPAAAEALGVAPITIPPLATRGNELARIVSEYVADGIEQLALPATDFAAADRDWVIQHATSLADIERSTLRLLAIRYERGNINRAAARLGMARMSLRAWIDRRPPPRTD